MQKFINNDITNAKTVHQTSLLHIKSNLDRLGLLPPTHGQRSQLQADKSRSNQFLYRCKMALAVKKSLKTKNCEEVQVLVRSEKERSTVQVLARNCLEKIGTHVDLLLLFVTFSVLVANPKTSLHGGQPRS